jgi:hypothetical protein
MVCLAARTTLAAETTLILLYAGLVYRWRASWACAMAWKRRARRLDALAGNRDAIPLAQPAEETTVPPSAKTASWQVMYPTPEVFFSCFFRAIMLIFLWCAAGLILPLY